MSKKFSLFIPVPEDKTITFFSKSREPINQWRDVISQNKWNFL